MWRVSTAGRSADRARGAAARERRWPDAVRRLRRAHLTRPSLRPFPRTLRRLAPRALVPLRRASVRVNAVPFFLGNTRGLRASYADKASQCFCRKRMERDLLQKYGGGRSW